MEANAESVSDVGVGVGVSWGRLCGGGVGVGVVLGRVGVELGLEFEGGVGGGVLLGSAGVGVGPAGTAKLRRAPCRALSFPSEAER